MPDEESKKTAEASTSNEAPDKVEEHPKDDSDEWEDEDSEEEEGIDTDDILDLAGETNTLFFALMVSPEFNRLDPASSPKPLFFVADFVRRTYLEYVLPLLPADAPYKERAIANPFLFEYSAEKPLPTEPNPSYLEDKANWPEKVNIELFNDARGRNTMVSCMVLEAHEEGSRGALVMGGRFDFSFHVKEVAAMIVGGKEVQEMVMRRYGLAD